MRKQNSRIDCAESELKAATFAGADLLDTVCFVLEPHHMQPAAFKSGRDTCYSIMKNVQMLGYVHVNHTVSGQ